MSDFIHQPVMMEEVLSVLQPRSGGVYVDGTLGGGGHAGAILRESSPNGRLIGCDQDDAAIQAAEFRLNHAGFSGRFEARSGRFEALGSWVEAETCDGAILDLGMSSPQIDDGGRGFSFLSDGPLDMRMNPRQGLTAAAVINQWSAEDLSTAFWRLADEKDSRRLARAIVERRESRPFETTGQLANLAEQVAPRRGRKAHPATRMFQALRMVVNDEVGALERGLPVVFGLLKPQARMAVITFHSAEDRQVKHWGQALTRDYEVPEGPDIPALRKPRVPSARWVSRKAILPSDDEIRSNPRSRSAQLRVLERLRMNDGMTDLHG